MFLQQSLITVSRDLSQLQIGLRRGQRAARLRQLLINLRSLNGRQQLAGFHVRPDVEIPLLQVAIGAGVNRRGDERLYVSGQDNFLSWRGLVLAAPQKRRAPPVAPSPRAKLRFGLDPRANSDNQNRSELRHAITQDQPASKPAFALLRFVGSRPRGAPDLVDHLCFRHCSLLTLVSRPMLFRR